MRRIFCRMCKELQLHMQIMHLWKCMKCGEYNTPEREGDLHEAHTTRTA
jgi:ribosomal protein L37AE/L43A